MSGKIATIAKCYVCVCGLIDEFFKYFKRSEVLGPTPCPMLELAALQAAVPSDLHAGN